MGDLLNCPVKVGEKIVGGGEREKRFHSWGTGFLFEEVGNLVLLHVKVGRIKTGKLLPIVDEISFL